MKSATLLTLLIISGCCAQAPIKSADCHVSTVCATCPPLPDWDGDLQSAPNTLAQYGSMYAQCSDRAQACHECIDRLRAAKVIN